MEYKGKKHLNFFLELGYIAKLKDIVERNYSDMHKTIRFWIDRYYYNSELYDKDLKMFDKQKLKRLKIK